MRLTSACLAACFFSGAVAAGLPAHAGDLSNGAAGGIRDYNSAGVPVPMPVAYEENFKWYVRGDVGTRGAGAGKGSLKAADRGHARTARVQLSRNLVRLLLADWLLRGLQHARCTIADLL